MLTQWLGKAPFRKHAVNYKTTTLNLKANEKHTFTATERASFELPTATDCSFTLEMWETDKDEKSNPLILKAFMGMSVPCGNIAKGTVNMNFCKNIYCSAFSPNIWKIEYKMWEFKVDNGGVV